MDISLFLAQAFGMYFIVMGLVMFRGNTLHEVITSFAQNKALKFFAGVFVLILGILLVLVHNVWEGPAWQVFITVMAWLTFLKGITYLLVPQSFYMALVRALNKNSVFVVGGIVMIVLGAWLAYVGFGF